MSNSPTEIESYIRPGCVILTIYLRMDKSIWDEVCSFSLSETFIANLRVQIESANSFVWCGINCVTLVCKNMIVVLSFVDKLCMQLQKIYTLFLFCSFAVTLALV